MVAVDPNGDAISPEDEYKTSRAVSDRSLKAHAHALAASVARKRPSNQCLKDYSVQIGCQPPDADYQTIQFAFTELSPRAGSSPDGMAVTRALTKAKVASFAG